MSPRTAVILATGHAPEFGAITAHKPRELLEVGGRSLIARQVAMLHAAGVLDIAVVTADQDARLRRHLGSDVTFIHNERHATTDSLYALWLAADRLAGGAFVFTGDVLLTPLLLRRLKWHPAADALVFDSTRPPHAGQVGVSLSGPFIVGIGEDLPPDAADGAAVGIGKCGVEGGRRLAAILSRIVESGDVTGRVSRAMAQLVVHWPVIGIDTDGLPWCTVDRPEGLSHACRVVAPAIDALNARGPLR
jgi:choline kinase